MFSRMFLYLDNLGIWIESMVVYKNWIPKGCQWKAVLWNFGFHNKSFCTDQILHSLFLKITFHCAWETIHTIFFVFQTDEISNEGEEDTDINKSEISLVFEIALKRNLPVNFEVGVYI